MSLRPVLFACALLIVSGCAPSVSPLYRDYERDPAPLASVDQPVGTTEDATLDRLRAALMDAGWSEALAPAPNVVTTEARTFGNWGLYRIVVSIDAIPIGERYVRVQFHPVRRYITGGRSKLGYLGASLRAALLPDLNAALKTHGFCPIGTPRERDEAQVEGT